MKSYFTIYQSCTEVIRPPISSKVKEYFEEFIIENVLTKKKIIIGGKWRVGLAMHFSVSGPKVLFKELALAKGSKIISGESLKLYDIVILIEPIQQAENPFLKTIELMYEAVKLFLTTTYKRITTTFMDELWKEVDFDYLLSLPYPAPLSEQKYIGDNVKPDGTVEFL